MCELGLSLRDSEDVLERKCLEEIHIKLSIQARVGGVLMTDSGGLPWGSGRVLRPAPLRTPAQRLLAASARAGEEIVYAAHCLLDVGRSGELFDRSGYTELPMGAPNKSSARDGGSLTARVGGKRGTCATILWAIAGFWGVTEDRYTAEKSAYAGTGIPPCRRT